MSVIKSHLNCIFQNLALEHALVNSKPTNPKLFLWRNKDCVVMGRNQNPHAECSLEAIERDGVDLCRRRTGGGCVFQDLENSVYTFVFPKCKTVDPTLGNELLIEAVRSVTNCKLHPSGRNDLLIGDRKVSGNAYSITDDNVFIHHGTLLRASDLTKISKYVTPHPLKFVNRKGCDSVKSRVTTLLDSVGKKITHDEFCDALSVAFERRYGGGETSSVDFDELIKSEAYRRELNELIDPTWIYGATLPYSVEHTYRVPDVGLFNLRFHLDGDTIKDVQIFTDANDPTLVDQLQDRIRAALRGKSGSLLPELMTDKALAMIVGAN